ncbi:MAG: polyphosphate kinase 1 [Eubacteriales bacterium]|nr:polyphosphate kinase 1 [Eubacteriales bacterium]
MDGVPTLINRESSWLDFNMRVLEEAQDPSNPLLERVKFLAITASNLDEFFMIRIADLKTQAEEKPERVDETGMAARAQYEMVVHKAHAMVEVQYACWEVLRAQLAQESIVVRRPQDISPMQLLALERYFDEALFPVLTPIAVDATRPFPLLTNKEIYLGVLLRLKDSEDEAVFAAVQVPAILDRFIALDDGSVILLEDVMALQVRQLFPGYDVLHTCPFRITRNSDLDIDEGEDDLMIAVEHSIDRRKWGDPLRLEVMAAAGSAEITTYLVERLGIAETGVFRLPDLLDLTALNKLGKLFDRKDLKDASRPPLPALDFAGTENIFEAIRQKDRLVQLPYESFDCVLNFVKQAAADPDVLAIKQTLYRVSGNSPIVGALIEAARNGKQVTVLVELKARFDEQNNIHWARRLEKAGCHVVYGLVGLKTHCKVLLVVRREDEGIRRYVHLGTGNYNDSTARLYTDMGLFSCREQLGADASALFNMLTGYSLPRAWRKFAVAPASLRQFFEHKIDGEIANARLGRPARIIAKMNSLVDRGIIEKLYEASAAGVQIDLIIRGMNSLRAGVPGLSENIRVRSIIGRYLEHSRIFRFENGGRVEIYMGSADWMPRNLDRRVEVIFPVEQEDLMARIDHILAVELADNCRARVQRGDGSYRHLHPEEGETAVLAQDVFYQEIAQAHRALREMEKSGVYQPKTAPENEHF